MSFIQIPDIVQQITVMKLSPNKKNLFVGVKFGVDPNTKEHNPHCMIFIYDLTHSDRVSSEPKKTIDVTELAASASSISTSVLGNDKGQSALGKDGTFHTNAASVSMMGGQNNTTMMNN